METQANPAIPEYSGKWWIGEIEKREKELDQNWRESAERVVKRYLDRRQGEEGSRAEASKYNIFWANVQIMKSALYATPPKPSVTRQWADANDDVGRVAALMLQRILEIGITKDQSDMNNSFKSAVEDRLIPGLGQVWLRYEAETEKYPIPAIIDPLTGAELEPATEGERIVREAVVTEHVNWADFVWSASRTWDENWWVARRIWMKKKKFIKRFGQKAYDEIEVEASSKKERSGMEPKGFRRGRVEVWEIWCEDTNKVYWVNPMIETNLDVKDDLYGLDDFFPCPRPLLATHTTNDVTPRPDYIMCQDQYDELDTLNDRIATLTRALRLVGVYDSSQAELKQLLTGNEFNMIPVENWAMFAEKNGMKGSVDWFPVEQVALVLEKLMIQRQTIIGQIYELTSISDIMRGGSNPRETLGAQKLKAQYSSVRLQLTQQDVGEFVRHAMRIKAEIACRMFQPETLIQQSQIENTQSAPLAQQAVAMLKDYNSVMYKLEISEESLSMADYNAEREMRIEYITAVGQLLSQAASMAQVYPQVVPYITRMIQWVTASFRGSSDIETVLDEAIGQTPQPQQPPAKQEKPTPDPEVVEGAKAKAQIAIDDNQLKNDVIRIKAEGVKDIMTQEPKDGTPGSD